MSFGFEYPLIEKVFGGLFRFVSVVVVVSIPVQNTETNGKKSLLVSRNKPKNNRNRLSFGLFWLEPKKKFDCFEDNLGMTKNIDKNMDIHGNGHGLDMTNTNTNMDMDYEQGL